MKKFIELKKVSKKYIVGDKAFYALKDVSFTIDKGEFVVILGPSGAGKSTLLNLIGGMDSASRGNIIIDGDDITKYNENQLATYRGENIGFVFQFYNLLPTLTVLENVELIKEVCKKEVKAKDALKAVGLARHINKFPSSLSGGEQQRVSIARAVAKTPKILLCDEPTGALDSKTGVEVLKLLHSKYKDDGNTVIIVTHNSLFADIADKVIYLKNGSLENIIINNAPKNIDEVNW